MLIPQDDRLCPTTDSKRARDFTKASWDSSS